MNWIIYAAASLYALAILVNLIFTVKELIKLKASFKYYIIGFFVGLTFPIFGMILANEVYDDMRRERNEWRSKYKEIEVK